MTRTGPKTGTRPGAQQPSSGLDGIAGAPWMTYALCRLPTFRGEPIHPDMWFPTSPAYALAHKVCDACPVQAQCLDYALTNETGATTWTRHGMYGGLTPDERAALAKETA